MLTHPCRVLIPLDPAFPRIAAAAGQAFENPLYDQSASDDSYNQQYPVGDPAYADVQSGYMDVPAVGAAGAGYMDVAPYAEEMGEEDV